MKLSKLGHIHKSDMHEHLAYHINEGLTLSESIFRVGSDSYTDFVNLVRENYDSGKLELSKDDQFIVERLQSGKKAIYIKNGKREKVVLDMPKRGSKANRKFYVFRPTDKTDEETGLPIAKILGFGDPNSTIKNEDEGARKSFLARHKCDTKDDMNTPGWWSCNVHKFWKQLDLKSDNPW